MDKQRDTRISVSFPYTVDRCEYSFQGFLRLVYGPQLSLLIEHVNRPGVNANYQNALLLNGQMKVPTVKRGMSAR